MAADSTINVVYVLTTDGRDAFSDMAIVSILSVRLSNPTARIHILSDAESAAALTSSRHRLLEACDVFTGVETPAGPPEFRNRWIKTQADQFVDGDFLMLDADTLVARDVAAAWSDITDIGAVANHNAPDTANQIWSEDLEFTRLMGWGTKFPWYANGGVLFFRRTPGVRDFFQRWHKLWKCGADAGRLRDQPALNAALRESPVHVQQLPTVMNCQMNTGFSRTPVSTAIWHFYGSQGGSSRGRYGQLLSTACHADGNELKRAVWRAIDRHLLDPTKPARRGVRLKPEIAAALEPARGRDIAILLSSEFEGLYRNGGIGTYYRELNRVLRAAGWFTILFDLHHEAAPGNSAGTLGLDHLLFAADFARILDLDHVHEGMLAAGGRSHHEIRGLQCLLFLQALANTFPSQRIYAEFHELGGAGYLSAKAKESGWLDPEVVVAITMHSGHEWVYEANRALISQDNGYLIDAATHEEQAFRSADLAMYPSESLHAIVQSYGWRTEGAVKIPYSVPVIDHT